MAGDTMFRSERMEKLSLLVLQSDVKRVTEALGRLGVLHLTQAEAEPEAYLLQPAHREADIARCQQLRSRVERLCEVLQIRLAEAAAHFAGHRPGATATEESITVERVLAELPAIEREIQALEERATPVGEEERSLRDILEELDSFREVAIPLEQINTFSFLHFALGSLPEGEFGRAQSSLASRALLIPLSTPRQPPQVMAITTKKGRFALQSVLKEHGFRPEEISDQYRGLPAEILATTESRLAALRAAEAKLDAERERLVGRHGARLRQFLRSLQWEEKLLQAQEHFSQTASTCLISGWVPARQLEPVRQRLLETTRGRCIIKAQDAEEAMAQGEVVPILLRHHRLIQPFEHLVRLFGMPGYHEIEPTLIVGFTFLLMFGLMFGDVGHGACLFVIGILLRQFGRKPGVRDAGVLFQFAAAAAILFGFLEGSVFGVEIYQTFLTPMANIQTLLALAVGFGTLMISLGLVLNVVNRIRQGDVFRGVFHGFGMMGAIFYWGAIGLIIRYAVLAPPHPHRGEMALLVFLLLGLPVAILIFRVPIYNLFASKQRAIRQGFWASLGQAAMEIFEMILSSVTNTISFVRVGAFALSHAALCLAIFQLERGVRAAPAGWLWSALILIVGHSIVIALEGLVVAIQSLRLEYYEFFSRFFQGDGKAFQPFRLE